ncbi:MAG: hypothetical protein Q8Q02_02155 [Nocardioides sp.]|nr:hypothetical protein [Nocardioides sp.]
MNRPHHRPALPGARHFESLTGGTDPAEAREAADRLATLLVRGGRGVAEDEAVVARVVALAEDEGLEVLADLWAGSPADSLSGALWRLYLLRTWVHADPHRAATEFDRGRRSSPVAEVVAGVADPPGPDEVRTLVDTVLGGVVRGDLADTLFRAAAFALVTATGRARADGVAGAPADPGADLSAARLRTLAEQLQTCGRLELDGALH